MAVVVLRLDTEEVSVLADCVAEALERDATRHKEVLERLLQHLRTRQAKSKHIAIDGMN